MKGIDLFLGVKAEQTLRDAVRTATDEDRSERSTAELCPVGQKDWIAGRRIDGPLEFEKLAAKKTETLKGLIELQSFQRIRRESIRVHAVRKPVPVFKDPLPDNYDDEPIEDTPIEETISENMSKPSTPKDENSVDCPVCGATVHTYNIQYDPWGKMVGCYLCRGDSNTHGNRS